MKKVLQRIVFGVLIGSFAFVAMLFIASAFTGGADNFIGQRSGEELLQLAACTIMIAVGFSVPSLVYEKENLANSLKVLIHMAAGTVVYLITAFLAGWIKRDLGSIAVYILIALGAAAIFWAVYMLVFKLQANKINRKIREKQDD
ncbi:MAG: DUF3021 domain-containing protein [Clostridia bacterium]|nr:DUF3021 domain-containing protein [Clostridia bacterium]